jgi:hypothetical protein
MASAPFFRKTLRVIDIVLLLRLPALGFWLLTFGPYPLANSVRSHGFVLLAFSQVCTYLKNKG